MKFALVLVALVALVAAQDADRYTWVPNGFLKTYVIDTDGHGSEAGDCNVTNDGYAVSSWSGLDNDEPSDADKRNKCATYVIPEQSLPTPPVAPTPTTPFSPTPFAPVPTPRNDGTFFVVGCASAYNPEPTPFAPVPTAPFPTGPTPTAPVKHVGDAMVRYFEFGFVRSDCSDSGAVVVNSNTNGFSRNSDTCIGSSISAPVTVNGFTTAKPVQFRVQCTSEAPPSATTTSSASSIVPTLFALALALVALVF